MLLRYFIFNSSYLAEIFFDTKSMTIFVEQIFTTWSYIMMYLKKYLVQDVVHVLRCVNATSVVIVY